MPKKKWITVSEAAEITGKSRHRIWALAAKGVLKSKHVERTLLIHVDSLEKVKQVRIGRPPGSKNKRPARRDLGRQIVNFDSLIGKRPRVMNREARVGSISPVLEPSFRALIDRWPWHNSSGVVFFIGSGFSPAKIPGQLLD